jgi:hypothetical protein
METGGSSPYSQQPATQAFLQYFVTCLIFYGEELLLPGPTPKLEDHLLSAVRDYLFNTFAATLHVWRRFLHPQPEDAPHRGDTDPFIRYHAVVTGTHLYGIMPWWRGPTYGVMPWWQGPTYHCRAMVTGTHLYGVMPWWQGPTYTVSCCGDGDPHTVSCRGDRDPLITAVPWWQGPTYTVSCRGGRDPLIIVPCCGYRDPPIIVPCHGDRNPLIRCQSVATGTHLITVQCRGNRDPLITVPCRGDGPTNDGAMPWWQGPTCHGDPRSQSSFLFILYRRWSSRGVKLINCLLVAPRLRMKGAIPPPLLMPTCPA